MMTTRSKQKRKRELPEDPRECTDENEFVRWLHTEIVKRGHISHPQNSRVPHGNTRYVLGTPDLLVCRVTDGKFIGLEAKMAGGSLTPSQKEMRDLYIRSGRADAYHVIHPMTAELLLDRIFPRNL